MADGTKVLFGLLVFFQFGQTIHHNQCELLASNISVDIFFLFTNDFNDQISGDTFAYVCNKTPPDITLHSMVFNIGK